MVYRFPPRSKLALQLVLGAAALIIVLVASLLLALDAGHLHGPLAKIVSSRTDRPVRFSDLSIDLFGGPPRITARNVVVDSPAWLPGDPLAEIGRLELTFQPTLRHPLQLRTLAIEHAVLRPRRDESDRANWRSREKPRAGQGGLLPIERLQLKDVSVDYEDERRHLAFTGRVSTPDGASAADPLRLEASGKLNGRAVQATLTGEPLLRARADRPWTFEFTERSSGTRLEGKGSVARPFDFSELDVDFEVEGASLRDLYYVVGVTMPHTGHYTGSGRLERRPGQLTLRELRARSGESDIAGTYVAKHGGKRPTFVAELRSRRAHSRDLGARAAGREPPRQGPPMLVPDERIPLKGLRLRDGRIDYRADEVEIGAATLRNVATRIRIEDGVLTADPLTAGASGRELQGKVTFDARSDDPAGSVELQLDGLPMDDVFRGKRAVPAMEAGLSGTVKAKGQGHSLRELLASADGTADLRLGAGTIRQSLAEALGVDLRAVGLMLSQSRQMAPLRCARAKFEAHDGRLVTQELLLDSETVTIEGTGQIDLQREAFDLRFRGHPKSVRLRLRTPLLVQGTFAEPAPRVETKATVAQSGAALAVGALVTPVAAAVAFIDPGRARDIDCSG